jgi:hypothetical protein
MQTVKEAVEIPVTSTCLSATYFELKTDRRQNKLLRDVNTTCCDADDDRILLEITKVDDEEIEIISLVIKYLSVYRQLLTSIRYLSIKHMWKTGVFVSSSLGYTEST